MASLYQFQWILFDREYRRCDVWGIYEFYIFQETKEVGQEVAFGQIVQTQRQRTERSV